MILTRNNSDQIAIQEDERLLQTNPPSVWQIIMIVVLTSVVVTAANIFVPSISHFGVDLHRYTRVLELI